MIDRPLHGRELRDERIGADRKSGNEIVDLVAKQGESIEIVGYGSLLSRASLERTVGRVARHELVRISGYVRVFDKVCVHSIESGAADPSSVEIACCCVTKNQGGGELLVSLSAITRAQLAPLLEREGVYAVSEVFYETLDGRTRGPALMFVRPVGADSASADAPIHISRGRMGPVAYTGPLWRTDILPARAYLRQCLRAAREHGDFVLDNFLDNSFLADRTLLRNYLDRHPDIAGDEDTDD